MTTETINEAKLNAIVGRAVDDFGAAASAALVVIGDKLGLYRALAGAGPLTVEELAERTGTVERYLRPWLINQAGAGYIDYDPDTDRYALSPEQAMAFAEEQSPALLLGGFQIMTAVTRAEPRLVEAFRNGGGVAWGEHDADLWQGTERFFRPGYQANLVQSWIPALDGVETKLRAGASVADVGCGHGASTIILAQAYPNSRFTGFDSHAPSIERARLAAEQAGVSDRVRFEVAEADSFPGGGYDLIAYFDCLHDMGDPVAAATYARDALAPGGALLVVEPMAGNTVQENFNPVGRVFSAASVLVCTANAMATGGKGLGTIATDDELRAVFTQAGFSRVRRATETPFNRVFEVRP